MPIDGNLAAAEAYLESLEYRTERAEKVFSFICAAISDEKQTADVLRLKEAWEGLDYSTAMRICEGIDARVCE